MIRSFPILSVILALFAALVLPQSAAAQQVEGTVNGTGTVTIKRLPTAVNMQVQISGEGKTIKEALAKLKERRETVQKKLAEMGASEDTIKFDDPAVAGQDRQSQMEAMMRARMRPGSPQPKPGADTVRVVAFAHARWPITAKSTEEMLVAMADLNAKVSAAKLTEDKTATLEEQEALEEAIGFDSDEMGVPSGAPVFTFVARVTAAERAKALAEAFQKAKTNAGDMAKAAGADLGALKQLSGNSVSARDYDEERYYYGGGRGMSRTSTDSEDPDEVVSSSAGMVVLNVYVTASFNLK